MLQTALILAFQSRTIGKTADRVVCTAIDPTKIHHIASLGREGKIWPSLYLRMSSVCFWLFFITLFQIKNFTMNSTPYLYIRSSSSNIYNTQLTSMITMLRLLKFAILAFCVLLWPILINIVSRRMSHVQLAHTTVVMQDRR